MQIKPQTDKLIKKITMTTTGNTTLNVMYNTQSHKTPQNSRLERLKNFLVFFIFGV